MGVIGQYVIGCGGTPIALACGQCTNAIDNYTFYIGIVSLPLTVPLMFALFVRMVTTT